MTEPLSVSELFYSIQGESTRAGLPCAFIRLSGCNLRCSYCDSRYSREEPGTDMDIGDILHWLLQYSGVMVEITGGEPLLQKGVYPLMHQLLELGQTVLLETNGSLSIAEVPDEVAIILDIKCPGSGMEQQVYWQNFEILKERRQRGCRDELKFVLSSEQDFSWSRGIVKEQKLEGLMPVLFSPVQDRLPATKLATLILENKINVRLQLQLHTILWPELNRGV